MLKQGHLEKTSIIVRDKHQFAKNRLMIAQKRKYLHAQTRLRGGGAVNNRQTSMQPKGSNNNNSSQFRSCFCGVWGDPYVGSLTSSDISNLKEADSKKLT